MSLGNNCHWFWRLFFICLSCTHGGYFFAGFLAGKPLQVLGGVQLAVQHTGWSMSPVARGDHGVDAWVDGEMSRGREGKGDGRWAAAFISWKLIPPFVHLAPSDKTGLATALVLCLFSPLHPSVVMGLCLAERKGAGYWLKWAVMPFEKGTSLSVWLSCCLLLFLCHVLTILYELIHGNEFLFAGSIV